MEHGHKYEVRLAHHVDVSEALRYLIGQLGCNNWYVACHHERLFVFRLTSGSVDKFAACFECTAPVEKGIYHDSKAWSLSLSPLHEQPALSEKQLRALEAGLAQLG